MVAWGCRLRIPRPDLRRSTHPRFAPTAASPRPCKLRSAPESGVNFTRPATTKPPASSSRPATACPSSPDVSVNLLPSRRQAEPHPRGDQLLRAVSARRPKVKESAEVRTRLDNLHQRLADPAKRPVQPPPAVAQPTAPPVASLPSTEVTKQAARRPVPKGRWPCFWRGGATGVGAGTGGVALATSRAGGGARSSRMWTG